MIGSLFLRACSKPNVCCGCGIAAAIIAFFFLLLFENGSSSELLPIITRGVTMSTAKSSNRLTRGSRQQPPMSCQSCRSRKLRCDRDHQCANCTSRGIPCQRTQTAVSTRPSPSPSASTQLLSRLEVIENIISLQSEHMNECKAKQGQPATLPTPQLPPSILSTPSSFSNNSVSPGSSSWHCHQDFDPQISTQKPAPPFPSSTGWLYRKRTEVIHEESDLYLKVLQG